MIARAMYSTLYPGTIQTITLCFRPRLWQPSKTRLTLLKGINPMKNPILAILLGSILGFAIVVPFGGLSARAPQPGDPIVRCDVMGCKTVAK